MKIKLHHLFATALLLAATTMSAQNNFKEEYAQYNDLYKMGELVYNGSIHPIWLDSVTFYYETREADGQKIYKVNVAEQHKELWHKDSIPTLPKQKRERSQQDTITSPDNQLKAFVKDNNIWIKNESDVTYQLSYDGTTNDSYTTIQWSPDSKKIAAFRKQDTPRRRIPLLESAPSTHLQPILHWRDYYKPGDVIPISRPALFDIESKQQIEIDTQPFEHQFELKFGQWSANSDYYTFEFNQRGHQLYQLIRVDATSGKTFVVAEEKPTTFVDYRRVYRHYLKDNKHVIWASERDNWNHLYLIEIKTGKIVRQLTQGNWVVRNVIHIDDNEEYMIVSGNGYNQHQGEDPYNIHYFSVNLKNGKTKDLTPENGHHRATFSSDYKYMVDVYSRPDTPPVSVVKNTTNGKQLMHLQEANIDPLLKEGYTLPEVFHAKGRDQKTDIWGVIHRPFNFDPNKEYPVVEYIYAGPHDSFVDKNFSVYTRFSKLLEMGFIVVTIDGMGTNNRSKSFHDVAWRNLKDSGFPDRILWIKEAAKQYPYMDIDRMGIYGYSAGGQSTLAALLFHPEFYKVGVSLCGCHDNRMDKIWWNEQWMGYPVGPWYGENSNVDNAHLLEGKLLLINGELDDNVDPTSTLQVVNALVKADKDFEQLYLPGYGHSLGDEYVTRKVFEFFVKHMR